MSERHARSPGHGVERGIAGRRGRRSRADRSAFRPLGPLEQGIDVRPERPPSFRSASGSLARASASRMPARSGSAFQCWRVGAIAGLERVRAGFEDLGPRGELGLQPAECLASKLAFVASSGGGSSFPCRKRPGRRRRRRCSGAGPRGRRRASGRLPGPRPRTGRRRRGVSCRSTFGPGPGVRGCRSGRSSPFSRAGSRSAIAAIRSVSATHCAEG